MYVAETYNNRIRKITASTNEVSTVAGTGNYGYSGDNGDATSAEFKYPYAVALDASGRHK